MIVVDTNIMAYFCLADLEDSLRLQAEEAFQKDPEWLSPPLWKSEFRNVLLKQLNSNQLSLEKADFTFSFMDAMIHTKNFSTSCKKILKLAFESGCSAYDCEFVALAKDLKVFLITADKKVLKAFPEVTISLKDFACPH